MTLEVKGLTVRYGQRPVLEGVDLHLQSGELVALLGPNGAGKSTLLGALLGLSPPGATVESQAIRWFGRSLSDYSVRELAGQVALVAQASSLGFGYSVREVVLMGAWAQGGLLGPLALPGALAQQRADQAMAQMDLLDLADRAVGALSGGEFQRVLVARALCQNTPALLLDEPTSAMDLRHALGLLVHLRELIKSQGRTMLWVTHDLNQALWHADRVVLMAQGRVAASGRPDEVLVPGILEPIYQVRVGRSEAGLRFWVS